MDNTTSEHVLLARIVKRGWTERLGREFESQFGEQIRWLIVVTMEQVGTLQGRVHPDRMKAFLEDRRLALYENTLSDLWAEVVNGLVERYVTGSQNGKIHQEFLPYLRGVIRHLVIANARSLRLIGRETSAELLASVCEAKRDSTYLDRLAWLKFSLEKTVRQEILARATPETFHRFHQWIHRVSDYFFERYVPSQCKRIAQSRGSALPDLLDAFGTEVEADEACEYIGTITPVARDIDDRQQASSDAEDSELLGPADQDSSMTGAALRTERLVIWDYLIRGEPVSGADVNNLILSLAQDAPNPERAGSVLLLAAIRHFKTMRPSSRWQLRAVLWYWFSQAGTGTRPAGFHLSWLKSCGLADLSGLCLTWPEVMTAMGQKSDNYSPLSRVQAELLKLFNEEWTDLFGKSPPNAINTLA